MHEVVIAELPVHRCENCKAVVMGEDADFAIRAKLREDLDLLQPDQILAGRKALGLSQDQLGELLGFAGESICRWERGVVQSEASNNLLRAFFDLPEFREYVGGVHLTALDKSEVQVWEYSEIGDETIPCWESPYVDPEVEPIIDSANGNYAKAA
jgi:DNA-binding transcriptional regulator YiaG